jgi:sulfur-carrier protein adenylyltransferase/sulfurtransferase
MNVLYETASPNPGGHRDIDPARLAPASSKVRLIDVREPDEYTGELGHISGAELVPLATVEGAAKGWENREQEIVMICRSGARSGRAATLLTSMGFRHVMNMTGGMIAWNAAQLPTER